jgi:hypothetical protein
MRYYIERGADFRCPAGWKLTTDFGSGGVIVGYFCDDGQGGNWIKIPAPGSIVTDAPLEPVMAEERKGGELATTSGGGLVEQEQEQPKDNTALYVAGGVVAVLALAGLGYAVTR